MEKPGNWFQELRARKFNPDWILEILFQPGSERLIQDVIQKTTLEMFRKFELKKFNRIYYFCREHFDDLAGIYDGPNKKGVRGVYNVIELKEDGIDFFRYQGGHFNREIVDDETKIIESLLNDPRLKMTSWKVAWGGDEVFSEIVKEGKTLQEFLNYLNFVTCFD